MAGCCGRCHELSDSVKGEEFLERSRSYSRFKGNNMLHVAGYLPSSSHVQKKWRHDPDSYFRRDVRLSQLLQN